MRHLITAVALVLVSSPAWAQSKPVCETFSTAEIASLLGKPASAKHSISGPDIDCVWNAPSVMFSVGRTRDVPPDVIRAAIDAPLQNPLKGEIVKAEPGIGDGAISTQAQGGRSVTLVFRSGTTIWTMSLERMKQKLDAAALPKLRALAQKAAR